ncbi:MAG: hypothetical protein RL497_711 [Pseudomonadota bacterium]|jgi:hypothetical protein
MLNKNNASFCFPGLFILLLAGCGGEAQSDSKRVKINTISFASPALEECIRNYRIPLDIEYVDELKTLSCGVGSQNLAGIEQLTALESLYLWGYSENVDVSPLKKLTTIYIETEKLDLSENKNIKNVEAKTSSIALHPDSALNVLSVRIPTHFANTSWLLPGAPSVEFELAKQTSLTSLRIEGNFKRLVLPASSSLIQLSINTASSYELINFDAQKNLTQLNATLPDNMEQVDLSNLTKLTSIALTSNTLTQVKYPLLDTPEITSDGGGRGKGTSGEVITSPIPNTIVSRTPKGVYLDNLTNLKRVTLTIPYASSLTVNSNDSLKTLAVFGDHLNELTLGALPGLSSLTLGNSQMKTLDLSRSPLIASLSIGDSGLKKLTTSNLFDLTELMIGLNSIEQLDLTENRSLKNVTLGKPMPAEHILLPNAAVAVANGYPKLTPIADFTAREIPDTRLRTCIKNAAVLEGAIYAFQLKRLECKGTKMDQHIPALIARFEGPNDPSVAEFVFYTEGLEEFAQLEYLDLSNNWVFEFFYGDFPKLKVAILNNNIIQEVLKSSSKGPRNADSLEKLALDGNPLVSLRLPNTLRSVSLNLRTPNADMNRILDGGLKIPQLWSHTFRTHLSWQDFSTPVVLENPEDLLHLKEITSDRAVGK